MIVYDKRSGTFTLHTGSTTYQMKADRRGVLLHLYYGPRLGDGDLGYLLQYADRGFSPNPSGSGADRVYSLDTLPQEYATCGVGDYRLSGAEVEQSDGSLLLDLRYADHEICPGKYALEGLPAFHGQGWETLRVVLRDPSSGVEVELLYGVCEEDDLITRAARLTNRGSGPVKLHQAMSLCLDLSRADLDLITFDGGHVRERNLDRAPLRPGVQGVGSVRGTSSHQHNPFVILCEHDAGEDHGLCYGAALLYSGNFIAQAERSQFADTRLVMGVHPHHFLWTLGPGETFTTPEAALVCSPCGLTPLTAELGMELFVMDDGWFGARDSDMSGLGDWTVNEKKLPGGLEALAPRIRALGLDFGLWIEPEMVSENSGLYRAHPDWALGAPGRPQAVGRSQLVLDFSRREVRDHIYAAMARLLDSAEISYLKWDMNRSLTDVWSAALPADRQGETYHRYVLGVYELLERLHRDYPDLLIEGCSGGGGRFDAGMLYYTPQIWCSDNTDAIDRLRIQCGTSFCYPVSAIGAHVSAVPNGQTSRSTPMETRGVVAMCGTFGYEMDLGKCTAEEKAVVREQVRTFKERCRLIQEGDYYRLTDPFRNRDYTAWQHVSPDRREALVSLVTGSTWAAKPFLTLRLKGLDPEAFYRVNGGGERYSGAQLMYAGYPIPPQRGDYQAVQLYLEAE